MTDSVVGPGAEANSELESQVKIKILSKSNEEGDILVARVVPPQGGERTPTDVCCVIDVSGSMGAAATTQGAGAEDSGLSLLDIVKHAVRTTIEVLQPEDRLGLIAYSSDAQIVCPLVAMDEAGKARAKTALTSMTPGGQTNLWDGLKKGLDMVREAKGEDLGHLSSVLLLTDGCPNIVPPRGHLPMLKKYRDNFSIPCSIHTFGFGYNLDSKLLLDLAVEGNGLYSFIPDAGFVGTCFCNALANVLVTMTKEAVLSIEAADGTKITADDVLGVSTQTADWGVQINLGALQFGQDKSIVFKIKNGEKLRPSVTLKYLHRKNPEHVLVTGEDDNDEKELMVQYARSQFVDTILNKCQNVQAVNCTKALTEHIEPLVNEIQSTFDKYNDPRLDALHKDVSIQVTEAFSKDEYFSKWGKHYLPSLARSHQLQMCSNFKDPGLQCYGGTLFSTIQDVADDLFNALPPPTPSIQSYSYGGSGGYGMPSAAAAAPRVINMSSYNNAGNPCFHGNCIVQMADGSEKLVASVRKGDRVAVPGAVDGAEVVCVVRTACEAGVTNLVTLDGGLMVTPYHPIRMLSGAWVFPCSLAPSQSEPCEAVYSFVLAAGHVMSINGRDCVTLGHGFQQNTVAHPFFGSSKVIAELSAMAGWHSGLVSLQSGCMRRDPVSGLACGFKIGCGVISHVDASEIYAPTADPVIASSVGEVGSIRVSC